MQIQPNSKEPTVLELFNKHTISEDNNSKKDCFEYTYTASHSICKDQAAGSYWISGWYE